MHLGFICTSEGWGGLELNVLRLADWLVEKGVKITFFTLKNSSLTNALLETNHKVVLIQKPRKYFDLVSAKKLATLVNKITDLETLFIFTNPDIDFVVFCKMISKKKLHLVYQQQMQIGVNKKDPVHTWRYNKLDAWIAPLKVIADDTLSKTNLKKEKIHVVPLCVDAAALTAGVEDKLMARNKLNLNRNRRTIGILGRIDPHKGQDTVIKAAYLLNQQLDFEVDVLIMGKPTIHDQQSQDYYEFVKKEVKDLGIQDNVHFRPYQEDPSTFFSAIDAFIMASKSETFGMVTIEAMMSGVPVIGTNSGGTVELLNFGEYGMLFSPEKHDELAKKIQELFSNSDHMDSISALAKKKALSKYSHDYECDKIIALVNSL